MFHKIARLAILSLVLTAGCQSYYYKLTDNVTKKDFYQGPYAFPPTQLPTSIALQDPKTGATTVTTQYTVTPITKEEYEAYREKGHPRSSTRY